MNGPLKNQIRTCKITIQRSVRVVTEWYQVSRIKDGDGNQDGGIFCNECENRGERLDW